jgi:hypothetical protein
MKKKKQVVWKGKGSSVDLDAPMDIPDRGVHRSEWSENPR